MSTTINKEEIQKFSDLADEWWDVNGKFKPLHMFNPTRIEYITENIKNHFNIFNKKNGPLDSLDILDIGCGGGLISEPMARLGAKVTGIDASKKNIFVASAHAKKNKLNIKYLNKSPEQMNNNEINRVQNYLRQKFGNEEIKLHPPEKDTLPAEFYIGDEFSDLFYRDIFIIIFCFDQYSWLVFPS